MYKRHIVTQFAVEQDVPGFIVLRERNMNGTSTKQVSPHSSKPAMSFAANE
jgi:hypothetical protein